MNEDLLNGPEVLHRAEGLSPAKRTWHAPEIEETDYTETKTGLFIGPEIIVLLS